MISVYLFITVFISWFINTLIFFYVTDFVHLYIYVHTKEPSDSWVIRIFLQISWFRYSNAKHSILLFFWRWFNNVCGVKEECCGLPWIPVFDSPNISWNVLALIPLASFTFVKWRLFWALIATHLSFSFNFICCLHSASSLWHSWLLFCSILAVLPYYTANSCWGFLKWKGACYLCEELLLCGERRERSPVDLEHLCV